MEQEKKEGLNMEIITVNGVKYAFESRHDLEMLKAEKPSVYHAIRTNNSQLIRWALEMYMDELERQDEKRSTGSYGKLAEVYDRVEYAIATGQRIWLHDIRCRKQGMDDHVAAGVRYERKTSFAEWEYGTSYDECMEKLLKKAAKGIVWKWEPFKDERYIIMPLSELLDILATYNPKKGLKVWFGFVAKKGQLQVQPVVKSEKRRKFVESLINA